MEGWSKDDVYKIATKGLKLKVSREYVRKFLSPFQYSRVRMQKVKEVHKYLRDFHVSHKNHLNGAIYRIDPNNAEAKDELLEEGYLLE